MTMLPKSWLHLFLAFPLLSQAQRHGISASQTIHARQYTPLSNTADLRALDAQSASLTNLDFTNPKSLISQILVPRPAGSAALANIQDLIVARFKQLAKSKNKPSWALEEDVFTDETPIGPIKFRNLVFTHNPNAELRLVLAAHLDSKYFPVNSSLHGFVGATDSAAPCAMLVDVAEALSAWLDAREEALDAEDARLVSLGQEKKPRVTVSLVFLDGEEAFEEWTAKDSIYGARHLVQKWSQASTPPTSGSYGGQTRLKQITTFVLLDLLGAPRPYIRNFFQNTGWLFEQFHAAEDRLGRAGLLWPDRKGDTWATEGYRAQAGDAPTRSFFQPRTQTSVFPGVIEDDHLPFLAKGVPVVHLIPVPFPKVWHTIRDDVNALDLDTVKAWSKICQLVVAEYLGLSPSLTSSSNVMGNTNDKSNANDIEEHARSTDELVGFLLDLLSNNHVDLDSLA